MADLKELFTNQVLELRRGVLIIAVLGQLPERRYGYELLQMLEDSGISIDAGTLYPLLRRLEKQEVLESEWETVENRPRKYYRVSKQGKELYSQLVDEWADVSKKLQNIIKNK